MPFYTKQCSEGSYIGKKYTDKDCYVIRKSDSELEKTTLESIQKGDIFRCFGQDECDVFEGYEDCVAEESATLDNFYGTLMTIVKVVG